MCRQYPATILGCALLILLCLGAGCVSTPGTDENAHLLTITDAFCDEVTIPDNPQKIAVLGSGSMRYFVYLDVDLGRIVVVDSQDSNLFTRANELRPYLLANPEIKNRSELGSAMAVVDSENCSPQELRCCSWTVPAVRGLKLPMRLPKKTGIPVVMFYVGDYVTKGDQIRGTLDAGKNSARGCPC